ncbi:diacylglycerol kinase iota-like protein, partial [Cricetulus griseus]
PAELLDMADSETGETALHKAACQRNRAVCQLLVDAGASLRQTDSKFSGCANSSGTPVYRFVSQLPKSSPDVMIEIYQHEMSLWGKYPCCPKDSLVYTGSSNRVEHCAASDPCFAGYLEIAQDARRYLIIEQCLRTSETSSRAQSVLKLWSFTMEFTLSGV